MSRPATGEGWWDEPVATLWVILTIHHPQANWNDWKNDLSMYEHGSHTSGSDSALNLYLRLKIMQQWQAHHPSRMFFLHDNLQATAKQRRERDTVYCLSHNVLYLVESKVHILLWGEADVGTDKQSGTGAKIWFLQAPWCGLKVRILSFSRLDRWQAKPRVTQTATF